jgi:regulator of sirC expression with transglutaminase-like and TPR domain
VDRAGVRLQLKAYQAAIADCSEAIRRKPKLSRA